MKLYQAIIKLTLQLFFKLKNVFYKWIIYITLSSFYYHIKLSHYSQSMDFFKKFLSFAVKENQQNQGSNKKKKDLNKQKRITIQEEKKDTPKHQQEDETIRLKLSLKKLIQNPSMQIHAKYREKILQEIMDQYQVGIQKIVENYVAPIKSEQFLKQANQIISQIKSKLQISSEVQLKIKNLLQQFYVSCDYQEFIQKLKQNQQNEFIHSRNDMALISKRQFLQKIEDIKDQMKKNKKSQKIRKYLKSLQIFSQQQVKQIQKLIFSDQIQQFSNNYLPKQMKYEVLSQIEKIKKGDLIVNSSKKIQLKQIPVQLFIEKDRNQIIRVLINKKEDYNKTKQRIIYELLNHEKIGESLKNENFQCEEETINSNLVQLEFKFKNGDILNSNQIQLNSIQKLEQIHEELKFINLKLNFYALLYWQDQSYFFIIKNYQSIKKFKDQLKQKFKVNSQRLDLNVIQSEFNQIQLSDDQEFSFKFFNSLHIRLTLILKYNLQHYGFNKNYHFKADEFHFFIEDQIIPSKLIAQCKKSKQQSTENFTRILFKFFYNAIKKGFTFMHVIQKFKGDLSTIIENYIWEGAQGQKSTLNQKFILFYFLANSQKKLKIKIMRVLSKSMPLPIVFRQFDSINKIGNGFKKNQDLKFILKQGITITSLGFEKNKLNKKGKSQFLSKVFFIQKDSYQQRHQICQKCPLLYLRIFGNKHKINLIDIPSDTNQQYIQQILKATNILIIQTWQKQQDVHNFIKKIRINGFQGIIYCFLRDHNCKLISMQNLKLQNDKIVQIPNLKNALEMHKDYQIIRKCIYTAIEEKEKNLNKAKIFQLFKDNKLQKFYNLLNQIDNRSIFNLKRIGKFSESLKDCYSNQPERQRITDEALSTGIDQILLKFFQYLGSLDQEYIQIFCYLFRQRLKDLKTEAMKPYETICAFKKKSEVLPNVQSQLSQHEFHSMKQYLQKIETIPHQHKFSYQGKSLKEIKQNLQKLISFFEQQVQPNIFSYELAWRQFIFYFKLRQIKKQKFQNELQKNLIKIKKIQIKNGISFQIIDGDLLQISKTFLKCIFNLQKRVCVISILGPQSSGKSTLLNFLFGCDFSASQGRCTRGVYGTCYELNQNQARRYNFQTILLLDTQGIMANTNLKDEKKRGNFDSKLILFCLTVSDIVLINTKGNIDSNTSNLLKLCKQKLDSLQNQQKQCPQYFLIQNMGTTTNMNDHIADINRLKDLFQQNKSKSLTQAYIIEHIDKKKICFLQEDQQLIKKKANQQFEKECLDLSISLFRALKLKNKKQKFRNMQKVIEQLEKSWITIQKFPSLFQVKSKQAQRIEQKINNFKKQINKKLSQAKNQYLNGFKNKDCCQQQIQNLYISLKNQQLQDFKYKIQKLSNKCQHSDSKNYLNLQLQKMKTYLQNFMNQIKNNIDQIKMVNSFQTQKRQGLQILKKKAQRIRSQMLNNIQFSESQLINQFQEQFNRTIKKLEQKINIQQQVQEEFKKIHLHYKYALSQISESSLGLPRFNFKQILKHREQLSDQIYRELLRQNIIFSETSNEQQYFLKYLKKIPINVLNGGIIDSKLKYLNMKEYFQMQQLKYSVGFYESQIDQILDLNKLMEKYLNNSKIVNNIERILLKFFQTISQKIENVIDQFTNFNAHNVMPSIIKHYVKNSFYLHYFIQIPKSETSNNYVYFTRKQKNKNKNKSNEVTIATRSKQAVQYLVNVFIDNQENLAVQNIEVNYYFKTSKLDQFSNVDLKQKSRFFIEMINFNKIEEIILNQKILKNYFSQLDKILYQKANQSLKPLNIKLIEGNSLSSYYFKRDYVFQKNKKLFQIIVNCELQTYKDLNFLKQKINKIDIIVDNYADYIQTIKIDQNQYLPDFVTIGYLQKKQFQVKQKYKGKSQLQKYISQNSAEKFQALQAKDMTQFLFNQLHQNRSIETFLDTIQFIIRQNIKGLNTDRSEGINFILHRIVDQIKEFNLDLQQVSHELQKFFVGQCHMYSICMIWKYYCKNFKKDKLGIIKDHIAAKQNQKRIFLNRCSNDQKKQIQAEVEVFKIQYEAKAISFIKLLRQKLLKEEEKKFKNKISRKQVQQIVDKKVFSISTATSQLMIQYIANPHKILVSQFKKLQNTYFESVKNSLRIKKNQQLSLLVTNIIQQAKQVKETLVNVHKITEETSRWDDFIKLSIQNKKMDKNENENQEQVFLKQGQMIGFVYLVDLFLNEPQKFYVGKNQMYLGKVKAQRQSINRMGQLSDNNIQILNEIKKDPKTDLSVKNIFIFLSIMINKFESIKASLSSQFQFNDKDFQSFSQRTKIHFCEQTCPCCKRICGIQHRPEINDSHKCVFGHQIRGFGNICLENGKASVLRCQQMMEHFKIKHGGQIVSWKQFKSRIKNSRNWVYDDCTKSDKQKQSLFTFAWDAIGKRYCEQNLKGQITYQSFQKAERENQNRIHYILALDQSSSMDGERWADLMNCINVIIQKLRLKSTTEFDTKISILTFNQNVYKHQMITYKKPSQIQTEFIQYHGGKTNFQNVFLQVCELINNYPLEEEISFIFMTDGQAKYPKKGIKKFKKIKNESKREIKYSSIVFKGNVKALQLLQQVANQLSSVNYETNNFQQLLKAYERSMEIMKDNDVLN